LPRLQLQLPRPHERENQDDEVVHDVDDAASHKSLVYIDAPTGYRRMPDLLPRNALEDLQESERGEEHGVCGDEGREAVPAGVARDARGDEDVH